MAEARVRQRHLDVRELEAPEPLVRTLAVLTALAPDDYLLLIHRREPLPLYDLLASMGWRHRVHAAAPDRFEIQIWRESGPTPPAAP
jgi:hypothetical protein